MASNRPIIIKKVKKIAAGHHGGAWKVAYADFVTAMMAFFLLMWLINTSSPEQKRGIADYFAPASVSASTSGSGGILGGTALGNDGAMQRGSTPLFEQPTTTAQTTMAEDDTSKASASTSTTPSAAEAAMAQREASEFQQAEMSLRQALQDMPELAELSRNIIVDQTPEGLRIQLVDQEGRPMFDPGSSEPNDRARILLRAVAQVVQALPNRVIISGHTDAAPNPDANNSNWELSAGRANGARRVIAGAGLSEDRISQVVGKAGSDPLFPDDPYQAANRRIAIVLQRASSPLPAGGGL
jgi:chemotaxis protein MotB